MRRSDRRETARAAPSPRPPASSLLNRCWLRRDRVADPDFSRYDDPTHDPKTHIVETPDPEQVPGLRRQVGCLQVDHDAPGRSHRHFQHYLTDANPLADETLLGEGCQPVHEDVRAEPHRVDLRTHFGSERRDGAGTEK